MGHQYKTLHETLNPAITYFSNKVALVYQDKQYTFAELNDQINNAAYQLILNQVEGNVGILLGNRPEAIFSIYGASKSGCTFVILNDKIKEKRLRQIILDAELDAIITDNAHLPLVEKQHVFTLNVDDCSWYGGDYSTSLSDIESKELAALMYTSGSTGEPKGVMCNHANIVAAIEIINEYLEHGEDDTILTALPLSHGYGLYQVLAPLAAGATVVLEPGFMFARPVLKRIYETCATGFAVVPTMLTMIFQEENWPQYLKKLAYLTNAGAGLPSSYRQKLLDNLRTTNIIPMYGQTECVRALYMNSDMINEQTIGSCGRPIPRTELFVVGEHMKRVEQGQVGELVVRGPTVMAGYWKKPEETAKTFVDLFGYKYLMTGDLFKQDDDGWYYYVGRKDDVVKIKGERTSPRELEDALYNLNGVKDVVAIPVPDKVWDNRFVVHISSSIVTRNDVMKYCRANLEPHMLPKDVLIYDDLPRNDNGKIDRKKLKEISLQEVGWLSI